jgi:hypothetical protein
LNPVSLDRAAKQLAGTQDMALADEFGERARAHASGKGLASKTLGRDLIDDFIGSVGRTASYDRSTSSR